MLRRTLPLTAFVLLLPGAALAFSLNPSIPNLSVAAIYAAFIEVHDDGLVTDGQPAPPATPQAALDGAGRLTAKRVDVREAFPVTLTIDAERTVFSLVDAGGHVFTGHLARKGA